MSTAIFNGTSRFSTDFQSVIDRSVAIASLPIDQLNTQKTAHTDQATALSTIDGRFSALQAAILGIQSATGTGSLKTSVSDGGLANVTTGAGALPGAYSLEVTSLGSFSNTLSKAGLFTVTDPATQNISPPNANISITVDGVTSTIIVSANTLNGLVDAINSQPGSNVQASIVNVGSTSHPDYRLSVQSTKLGAVGIQLKNGTQDLLDTLTTGTLASYKINGLATAITSDSRSITLAPGVTANLLSQSTPGVAATITVAQDPTALGNALASFANAYNAASAELDKNRGVVKGPLSGENVVYSLANALRNTTNYSTGASGIGSLTSLGITFDSTGKVSFDQSVFTANTANHLTDLNSFLGSTTTGGFLKNANDVLTGLEDPSIGVVKTAVQIVQQQISHETDLIATNQLRVDTLKKNLQDKLNGADALIASLEQQVTNINSLFQALLPGRS